MQDVAITLTRDPQQVRQARHHVAGACHAFDDDFVHTATLLTSELVTNAVEHGAELVELLVASISAGVRVDVVDGRPGPPRSSLPEAASERGRGLLIVDALATDWGIDLLPEGGGKSVWFVLLAAHNECPQ